METLATYIAADNPVAALQVLNRIDATVQRLAQTPVGRPGRVAGTYENPVPHLPYIVAYAFQPSAIEERIVILRVIHGARNWPEGEWPE
jgi:toxin ParE1/3/4